MPCIKLARASPFSNFALSFFSTVQEYLFLICIHNIKTGLPCFYHAKQELGPIADHDCPTSDLGFKALIIWDLANLVSDFHRHAWNPCLFELDRITTLFFVLCSLLEIWSFPETASCPSLVKLHESISVAIWYLEE